MSLDGKYLDFDSRVTEEIFNSIIKLLIETYGKSKRNLDFLKPTFENYKDNKRYIITKCKLFNWSLDNNDQGQAKATIEEILGYDPFAKEEFILPEKWRLKITKENSKIINNWRNDVKKISSTCPDTFIEETGLGTSNEWGIEITFDQFKKYVLRESIEKPKQPLKQAVHCKTQEEWDFMLLKIKQHLLNPKHWAIYTDRTCWTLFDNCCTTLQYCSEQDGYQILSFQKWCDLNGYKMEKEVRFEVGKWYKLYNWISKFNHLERDYKFYGENINTNSGFVDKFGWLDLNEYTPIELSIEEIQQYLPENHPDKIKSSQEFKVGDYIFVMIKGKNFGDILKVRDSFIEKKSSYSGVWINHTPKSFGGGGFRLNGNGYIYGKDVRHATPEEINNHLISIGQIPADEPLNNGIEPNKDGAFKYTTNVGSTFVGNCSTLTDKIPVKPKLILSIDDEELPMVNIIKTNSIKQLLNND